MGLVGKANSWELMVLLVTDTHRFDPGMALYYCHCIGIVQALWKKEKAWQVVGTMPNHPRAIPNGPWGTFLQYIRLMDMRWHPDEPWTLEAPWGAIRLLQDDWLKVKDFFQQGARHRLKAQAEHFRTHLEGVRQMNIKVTRALMDRMDFPRRGILGALITDALWPKRRKYVAGLVQDDQCERCKVREDAPHITFFCERFAGRRVLPSELRDCLASAPRCVRECLHYVDGLPVDLKTKWPAIQAEATAIWAQYYDEAKEADIEPQGRCSSDGEVGAGREVSTLEVVVAAYPRSLAGLVGPGPAIGFRVGPKLAYP